MALLTKRHFVLASASARRLMLLQQVGIAPEVIVAEVAEAEAASGLAPAALVTENARRKAQAVASRLGCCDAWILGADTVVALDGMIFGKPRDAADARRMLQALSGRTHSVFTGQCLVDGESGRSLSQASETRVRFAVLDAEEIDAYVATGEPLDKAGAYGMQAQAGTFVLSIEGDYSTVVGLSLPMLRLMLRALSVAEDSCGK